jgi:predicted SprT family Zn-dependent metalloprotease
MWLLLSQLRRMSLKIQPGTRPSQLPLLLPLQQLIPQQRTHINLRAVLFTTPTPSFEDSTAVKSNDAGYVTDESYFRRNRDALAQHWLTEFDTVAFGGRLQQANVALDSPIVSLKWSNRLRTTAGRAHLMRQTIRRRGRSKELPLPSQGLPRRTAVIELSTKVVDDVDRLKITLLHEMCHAAAWIVDGSLRPPHGPYFQKWAQRATAAIPSIAITTKHNFKVQYKYFWTCVNTACPVQIIGRHSKRSIDIERHVCGKCHGPLHVVVPDTASNSNQKASASRPLTEYHRFIQKHSKVVARQLQAKQNPHRGRRKSLAPPRKISPRNVMKETARLWQKKKKQTNASSFVLK